jgi:hypothetical protein
MVQTMSVICMQDLSGTLHLICWVFCLGFAGFYALGSSGFALSLLGMHHPRGSTNCKEMECGTSVVWPVDL